LELPLPGGRILRLRGRIDRVDVREDDDGRHVLVIDYKRSPRSGLPAALEAGVDLQLAVYLLFAQQAQGMVPAGGLYVPVIPSPPRSEKLTGNAANRLGIRAHGFVLKDEAPRIDAGLEYLASGRSGQMLPSAERMGELLATARRFLVSYATTQSRGWIAPRPLLRESRLPCERCEMSPVCRYRKGIDPRRREAGEGMVPVGAGP
jgi:ATP-dependent helicase/nuclease subunit B